MSASALSIIICTSPQIESACPAIVRPRGEHRNRIASAISCGVTVFLSATYERNPASTAATGMPRALTPKGKLARGMPGVNRHRNASRPRR
jgi:hypothetical protein